MQRVILAAVIAAGVTIMPAVASATTPPSDPNDVAAVDNPVDENDDGGFDDWGLLGLLGLLGLAGLKRRDNRVVTVDNDRTVGR
jgi:MYXO-CTERM domain-containing protein